MRWWLVLVLLCSSARPAWAQITPPGLGEANTAGWLAAGVRQDLNERWRSMTYAGAGAKSDSDDLDPLRRPAIVVVNEELYHRFAPQWTYSLALSYRRQNEYGEEVGYRHELRLYGRLSHTLERGRLRFANTLRSELRSFLRPGLVPDDEALQLRVRLRSQLAVGLDRAERQRVIASAEVLSSLSKERARWSTLDYRESRFCLYYSLERTPVVMNFGYMNNLLGRGDALLDVHYLAFDVTWNNPFGTPGHARGGAT